MTDDTHLDDLTQTALADLDASPLDSLTSEQQARAETTLASILTALGISSEPDTAPRRGPEAWRGRPKWRRVLLSTGTIAAATVGMLVVQSVTAGDAAYASWTARPSAVPSADERALGESCRAHLLSTYSTADEESLRTSGVAPDEVPHREALAAAPVVIAEERGHWRFALLADASGLEATCMLERPGWFSRLAGESYAAAFGMIGMHPASAPASDSIAITNTGAGTTNAGGFVEATGLVGTDVVEVTVDTPDGPVVASVRAGRFAAWWPDRSITATGELPPESFLVGRTVTVRLKDGRILRGLSASTLEQHPAAG